MFNLVLERYVAVVKPLKYLTFMKHRRVIQMVLTSWGIPFLFSFPLVSIRPSGIDLARIMLGYLGLLFEIILCAILIFFEAYMFVVVYFRDRTFAEQLQFNHMVVRAKTQNKVSAVKWAALITCVFLSCYGLRMCCSLLFLTGQSCNDFHYKIPLQVINSGINPIAYAFFKRDIKQECKRLLFEKASLINNRIVPTQEKQNKDSHKKKAVTILPLADISGRCEQFGNELLHSRSRILSRILHISHGIDMIFYETSTKTYFNPPDYTHMHSRTDINQHGRQLIRSSSPSAVLIITPSPSAELNVLTQSNNSHSVK